MTGDIEGLWVSSVRNLFIGLRMSTGKKIIAIVYNVAEGIGIDNFYRGPAL